jgi:hypothetical protein
MTDDPELSSCIKKFLRLRICGRIWGKAVDED